MASIPIHTYDQIPKFIDGVFNREIDLLVIESIGGLGKTYTVIDSQDKETQEKDMLIFSGHVTPLEVYMQIYNNPTKILVFDDVDAMLKNKSVVAILKQVCLIGQDKTISYTTSARYDGKPVPRTFTSNNKVIILCNNISAGGRDMEALLSRGFYLNFDPTPQEVHRQLSTFAEDEEILKYLKAHLDNINGFNFRVYQNAHTLKRMGLDWESLINSQYRISNTAQVMRELKEYGADKAEREFMRKTGKPTSAYYSALMEQLKELKKDNAKKKWKKRTTATQRTFYRYWNRATR